MFENTEKFKTEVIRHACRALEPKNVRTLAALTELPYCTGMSAALAAEDIMDAEVAARRAGVRIIKGQKRYVGYLNNPNAL